MSKTQGWIAIGLLCVVVILSGMTIARQNRLADIIAESQVESAATVYIHGRCEDASTGLGLAGCTVSLWYGGRRLGGTTTVAGGWWGSEVALNSGLYQVWAVGPPGWQISGVLPGDNVTDLERLADPGQFQFRVSPSGRTGDIFIWFQNALTPTPTWIPTPTYTATPWPTPTFTATPVPVTPSPSWTPGPTPTICWRAAPQELVDLVVAGMDRQYPAGDSEVTQMGFCLGLGWPIIPEEAGSAAGEAFTLRLFSPFYILIRWASGCWSVIDPAALQ